MNRSLLSVSFCHLAFSVVAWIPCLAWLFLEQLALSLLTAPVFFFSTGFAL
jgi:hypothetical protein